ncbi:MAG: hypothetical protein HY867_13940 [Chloroflexi bacterium]|nr:hypothetical protein [Chloroflexota bacterium]
MDARIAILTAHSLFADGITSRLQEYSTRLEFQVFDIGEAGFLAQVLAFNPSVIFLEEEVSSRYEECSLEQLLTNFTNVTIVFLHISESKIQVILSEQYVASDVHTLVEFLRPLSNHRLGMMAVID